MTKLLSCWRTSAASFVPALAALLLLSLASQAAWAQHRLVGQVFDDETETPLAGANVFLANTLRGTISDENGQFILTDVAPGLYEVVASMVGYEAARRSVRLGRTPPALLTFSLTPRIVDLAGVTVADLHPDTRRKYRNQFIRHLMGVTAFAEKCTLENPEVLDLTYNASQDEVHVTATAPLVIKNDALGYRLHFVLDGYTWYEREQYFRLQGSPRFEELTARRRTRRRWRKNRAEAYRGSLRHFMASLLAGTARHEGYRTHQQWFPETAPTVDFFLEREAWQDDSLHIVPLPMDTLLRQTEAEARFFLDGFVRVTYHEENEYYTWERQMASGRVQTVTTHFDRPQTSLLRTREPLHLDAAGHVYNLHDLTLWGYWTWEGLADMLPWEYAPE